MKMDHYDRFVLLTASVHILLFIAGYMFVGYQYTLVLFIFWGVFWLSYCASKEIQWEDPRGSFGDTMSVMALALIGGPMCWMLAPTCVLPQYHRSGTGFVILWNIVLRLIFESRKSVLKIMGILFQFCEKKVSDTDGSGESQE